MKQLLRVLAVAAALLFASFNGAYAKTIELWHAHQSQDFVNALAKKFEQKTGHKVNVLPFNTSKVKAELLLAAEAGLMPDAILVPSDYLGLYRELILAELDSSWFDPDLSPTALGTTRIDDAYRGIPIIQGNHLMLFYNKAFVSKPASSWAELNRQAQELRESGVEPIGWKYGEMYWFVPFLGAFGGWPMTGTQVTLDTPEMVKALDFYKGLADSGLINRDCEYDCAQKDFIAGKYAYAINGDWAFKDLQNELGDKFGVAVLPAIANTALRPMTSSFALGFPITSVDSDKQAVLKEFAHFAQALEVQQHYFSEFSLLPTNQRALDLVISSAADNEKQLLAQLADAKPMPSERAMAVTWQAMAKGFIRFMEHGYSAQRAATYMQSLANRELAKQPSSTPAEPQ